MRNIILITAVLFILAHITILDANSSDMPKRINGGYYEVNNYNCFKFNIINSKSIQCYYSNGQTSSVKYALSDQELNMRIYNQQKIDNNNRYEAEEIKRRNEGYIKRNNDFFNKYK